MFGGASCFGCVILNFSCCNNLVDIGEVARILLTEHFHVEVGGGEVGNM